MIYILENNEKYYKIGYSKDPERRVKQLNTGNSTNLKLLHKFTCKYDSIIESNLQKRFKHKNIKGEWFDLSEDDINSIKSLIKMQEKALDSLYEHKNIFI